MDNGSLFGPPDDPQGGPTQELAPFEFPFTGAEVRVVLINDEPWFAAVDVCSVLGIARPQDSVRYLDEDERGRCLLDTPSGEQEMLVINESGLYSLILRSRKPLAKAFKKWITSEVLPSVRKTGSYGIVPEPRRELTNRELAMMVLEEADRADRAEVLAASATAKVHELTPGHELAETFAAANGTMTVRTFARNVQQWAQPRGVKVLQEHVFAYLGMIGMVIRAGTSEKGQATATALKAGWCENATTDYETHTRGTLLTTYARLTPKGVRHAWKRIHSTIGEYNTLDPKVIRP